MSDETSLSDKRYVLLQAGDREIHRAIYGNPKRTNWESYREDPKVNLGVVPRKVPSERDVDFVDDPVQQAVLYSSHQNCPATVAVLPRRVLWFSE
jgi:hypothetical protein